APEFFPNGAPNFSIQSDNCFIHVTPNQWCRTPYYWKREEEELQFLSDQINGLEASLAKHPDAIHIFSTHGSALGVPSEQTGFEDSYDSPEESFSRVVFDLVRRHPQIRCVLSGHNHINTHVEQDGVHFVTASGLVETPFEFKVIEAGPEMLKMSTVNLVRQVDVEAEYDYNKTYVQGREKDRTFQERL
ncbi:MAG: hypothetical protein KAV00_04190, partial [Phycisphaerae bacterium]|nr:hypothetical protein [Phycisphaerae bacterium]